MIRRPAKKRKSKSKKGGKTAKLTSAPNWGIISRLKPPLDFYQLNGIWIVRVYPLHIKQPGTTAQKKTWAAMLTAVAGWKDLKPIEQDAWKTIVRDAHRTGKDFYYVLHLKGETENKNPWVQINTSVWAWGANILQVIVQTQIEVKLLAYHCGAQEQRASWRWGYEGYCIRGRKMVRKRKLYENWPEETEQEEENPSFTHTFNIAVDPGQKIAFITFKPIDTPQTTYRGRSGVYGPKRGG